jgi:type IV secretion system protein VirB9
MRTITLLVAILAGLAGAAAQETDWTAEFVSAQDDGPPPQSRHRTPIRLDPLAGPDIRLKAKERRALGYGKEWADNGHGPARGEDGSIQFVFGATLPVIVCAPLYVCDLALQPDETINDIHIGDGVRWQITPATQGSGDGLITHVMIKPTDIGLVTNLVITTDRRAYTIQLVSRREDWMPRVTFYYPDEASARWSAYRQYQDSLREAAAAAEPVESAAHLDFAYEVSGDNPSWRPVRVYSNGAKTYIQFPQGVAHSDLPALVALGSEAGLFTEPSTQLINYRYVNGRFEVDKVLDRAALISGVGWDQVSVRIRRRSGRR